MWRFGTPAIGKGQVENAVTQAKDLYLQHHPTLPEAKLQIDAACQAVVTLVRAGAFGSLPVQVSIAGHANPQFRAREGWLQDQVNITVVSVPGQAVISPDILPSGEAGQPAEEVE
jgi:hypothetical protein